MSDQQPPAWPPQPAAPKQRNWFVRHKVLTGIGVIIIIAIIASAAGSGGGGSKPANADHPTAAASSAPTQPAAAAPATLLQTSGNGDKQTAEFTAAGDWGLAYSWDCTKFGTAGTFAAMIYGHDGHPSLSNQGPDSNGMKGSDVTHEHHGGTYYLSIISECDWSVTVTG